MPTHDLVLLDPQWLGKRLSDLVKPPGEARDTLPEAPRESGELLDTDLAAVWPRLEPSVRQQVVQLLHALEVAHPARTRTGEVRPGVSIVPSMLPVGRPQRSVVKGCLGGDDPDEVRVVIGAAGACMRALSSLQLTQGYVMRLISTCGWCSRSPTGKRTWWLG